MLGAAILQTLLDIATVFGWLVLFAAAVVFGAIYVVEPLEKRYISYRNHKRWKALVQVRREWELDELRGARVSSQSERWEYVYRSPAFSRGDAA